MDHQPPPIHPAGNPTNSKAATASMILGILGLLTCITALPAVICGHIGLNNIRKSGDTIAGKGKAIAGLIMGYLIIVSTPVIAILAALLIPALTSARSEAQLQKLLNDGTMIYKIIYAADIEDPVFGDAGVGFPKAGQYQSSTEYFHALLESDPTFPVDYLFDENGKAKWCVVEGGADAPADAPFLFTPNLPIETTDQSWDPLDVSPLFGKANAAIVINQGGAGFKLKRPSLQPEIFNPADHAAKVLRP